MNKKKKTMFIFAAMPNTQFTHLKVQRLQDGDFLHLGSQRKRKCKTHATERSCVIQSLFLEMTPVIHITELKKLLKVTALAR
jgi:16S rRNA U1498 N3-methylase RsmE